MPRVSEALQSSGKVSVAIFGSRLLGLVREQVFAALFGAGMVADAYFVAFRLPNLLRDLFAEGALAQAFVPTFTSTEHDDGRERAHALANLAASGLVVITGTLSAVGIVFAEPIVVAIADGFSGDAAKVALAARLARVMMPFLCIVSLSAVFMGMLNARRRFVVPALAPALFNVVSLVVGAVVWVMGLPVEDGVFVWSLGTLIGGAGQALVQLPALWRMGYRPWPRVRGLFSDPGVRRIARLMAPAVAGVAAIQLNVFINTRFAASLGDGPVAQLGYAFRLFFVPLGVFGVAIATVTTTHVSEEAAKGDRQALVGRTAASLSAGWMLTVASAVGLAVLAEPLCTLIYRHGRTSTADVQQIALVLQAYSCGLVPYALIKIVAPAFYSIDRPRIPLLASMAGVATNVTFNALTYRALGPPGIALGTGLGALVNVTVLRIAYGRVVGTLPSKGRARGFAILAFAAAVMGGAVWGAGQGAGRLLATLGPPSGAQYFAVLAIALVALVGLGFVVFAGLLRALGHEGGKTLWSLPSRLLRRR